MWLIESDLHAHKHNTKKKIKLRLKERETNKFCFCPACQSIVNDHSILYQIPRLKICIVIENWHKRWLLAQQIVPVDILKQTVCFEIDKAQAIVRHGIQ